MGSIDGGIGGVGDGITQNIESEEHDPMRAVEWTPNLSTIFAHKQSSISDNIDPNIATSQSQPLSNVTAIDNLIFNSSNLIETNQAQHQPLPRTLHHHHHQHQQINLDPQHSQIHLNHLQQQQSLVQPMQPLLQQNSNFNVNQHHPNIVNNDTNQHLMNVPTPPSSTSVLTNFQSVCEDVNCQDARPNFWNDSLNHHNNNIGQQQTVLTHRQHQGPIQQPPIQQQFCTSFTPSPPTMPSNPNTLRSAPLTSQASATLPIVPASSYNHSNAQQSSSASGRHSQSFLPLPRGPVRYVSNPQRPQSQPYQQLQLAHRHQQQQQTNSFSASLNQLIGNYPYQAYQSPTQVNFQNNQVSYSNIAQNQPTTAQRIRTYGRRQSTTMQAQSVNQITPAPQTRNVPLNSGPIRDRRQSINQVNPPATINHDTAIVPAVTATITPFTPITEGPTRISTNATIGTNTPSTGLNTTTCIANNTSVSNINSIAVVSNANRVNASSNPATSNSNISSNGSVASQQTPVSVSSTTRPTSAPSPRPGDNTQQSLLVKYNKACQVDIKPIMISKTMNATACTENKECQTDEMFEQFKETPPKKIMVDRCTSPVLSPMQLRFKTTPKRKKVPEPSPEESDNNSDDNDEIDVIE